jgi:hypothetical protein
MNAESTNELYALEKVRFIIKDACDIDIAYAYDDLVFSEHGLFILQFLDKEGTELACWFNQDCIEQNKVAIFNSLAKTATLNSSNISYKGKFVMNQKEGSEEIDIKFFPN